MKTSGEFPDAMRVTNQIAAALKCSLSRATIACPKARSKFGLHFDFGSYYLIRNRFYLVLRSPSGSVLLAGDQQVRME